MKSNQEQELKLKNAEEKLKKNRLLIKNNKEVMIVNLDKEDGQGTKCQSLSVVMN